MQPDFVYTLTTPSGEQQRIPITLMEENGAAAIPETFIPPDWARLSHHQCSHCPLDPDQHPYCPIARNLAYLLPDFVLGDSFQPISLDVETPQRHYQQDTTLQRALSSLFGLICALSDCPHTQFLRPMARFHLPLSSSMETLVRTASLHLLQRYIRSLKQPDMTVSLEGLDERYDALNELNRCFTHRLRQQGESDAPVNALVLLHLTAREMHWSLEEELEGLVALFDTPRD